MAPSLIMNKVLVSGDSWTSGWPLEETQPREQFTWPNIVAKHYNLQHYNFSVNGHSNQDIARQVLIATNIQKEKKLNPIYWIGWTKYKHLGLAHYNGHT